MILHLFCSMRFICQFNSYLTEAGDMHEAGYFTLSVAPGSTSHQNIYNCSFLIVLEVLLYFVIGNACGFWLMRNLYVHA